MPSEQKLLDPFVWELHECAKMSAAKTENGELDEYK
jgi:hypothetical protein